MDDMNELVDQDHGPLVPAEPAPPIESRFLFVDVAALRAKQLRRGARVKKPERMAMEEVRRGLVAYQVPEPKAPRAEQS
jgi:DNA-directed RNA polymerase subunit K/omega